MASPSRAIKEVITVKAKLAEARASMEWIAKVLGITLPRGSGSPIAPAAGKLSPKMRAVVAKLLSAVAEGRPIAVLGDRKQLLSTTEAAELLSVSRPHVVKLIDSGLLPATKTRSHRRLHLGDVLEYRARVEQRHASLDALAALESEIGLGVDTIRSKPGKAPRPPRRARSRG